jgi:hypothetical protein
MYRDGVESVTQRIVDLLASTSHAIVDDFAFAAARGVDDAWPRTPSKASPA